MAASLAATPGWAQTAETPPADSVSFAQDGADASLAPAGLPSAIVLPPLGYGSADVAGGRAVRVGTLSSLLAPPAPAGGGRSTAPAWQVTPSVGVTEEYNSNPLGAGSGRAGGDLISILQPGVLVRGDTQRVQVNLGYTPQVYLYARNGDQDQVAQDFNGRALATIVPRTLFLDLRGLGTQVATFGAVGPAGASTLNRNNSQQAYSFSASPYLLHRFGGFGTGEVGYTVARTVQSGKRVEPDATVPGFPFLAGQLALANNQDVTTQNVHAAFTTGEDFSRYNGTALASATRFDGSGVLHGAHRDIVSLDSGYAVTRNVTALATLGYEDIHYAGTAPVSIHDLLWSVGARLAPNADSSLVARYGHHDGFEAFSLDAALAPSPRTRIDLRYSAGLTSGAEQLQNALATTDLDALGEPVDHTTGAPILDATNFFGLQNGLYRVRNLSVSAAWLLDRDTFVAEVDSQDSRLVSGDPGETALGSNAGTFGSLTWSREITPKLRGTAFFQYGARSFDGPPATSQALLVTSLSLSYQLGKGLVASAQYSFDRVSGHATGGVGGTDSTAHLVLFSVVKTF